MFLSLPVCLRKMYHTFRMKRGVLLLEMRLTNIKFVF